MLTQDEINEYFAVADELRVQFDDTRIVSGKELVQFLGNIKMLCGTD